MGSMHAGVHASYAFGGLPGASRKPTRVHACGNSTAVPQDVFQVVARLPGSQNSFEHALWRRIALKAK